VSNKPQLRKIFLLPDVHAPFHHKKAYRTALAVIRGWAPDTVVVLGDFADCNEISSFPKDPSKRMPFRREIALVNRALDELDGACDEAGCDDRQFLQGNHETRLERYVARQAPELDGLVTWDEKLHLTERGWVVTPYMRSISYGHLNITHDVGRSGVNAARASMLDLGSSLAFGHTHRLQVHYQGQLDGSRHVGATLGWLGDPMAIDYRHRNAVLRDSIHGFGVVHLDERSGEFWLTAVPIIRGRAVVDGVVYRG